MRQVGLAILTVAIALILLTVPVMGQVSVDNDGPSFVTLSIEEDEEIIIIDILLRDLNGWDNINNVTFKVLDAQGKDVSKIIFEMHNSLDTSLLRPRFEEITGSYLIMDDSSHAPEDIPPWNPYNTDIPIGLNVRLALQPLEGETILIVAQDVMGASTTYESPLDLTPEVSDDNPFLETYGWLLIIILLLIVAAMAMVLLGMRGSKKEF